MPAPGIYRVEYAGGMLAKADLRDVVFAARAQERVDLIGNARSHGSSEGKLPAAEALGLVPAFHGDPSAR